MPKIYWSGDDGALYPESSLDEDQKSDADSYKMYEIPDTITLTADQIACGQNDILGMLMNAGIVPEDTE